MKFVHVTSETTPNYEVKMYGNINGTTFPFYEGIMLIEKRVSHFTEIFFFKSRHWDVDNQENQPVFNLGHLIPITEFGSGHHTIDQFCENVKVHAEKQNYSPFRFIDFNKVKISDEK